VFQPLETCVPGVFAIGDVRHKAVKRVASAVGEGSIVVRQVLEYLAAQKAQETPAAEPQATASRRRGPLGRRSASVLGRRT
jgi:pyruvate/2-oxoglutarate dehydrogenase complex dihydrolipoamide dehydrogenase (E3) component